MQTSFFDGILERDRDWMQLGRLLAWRCHLESWRHKQECNPGEWESLGGKCERKEKVQTGSPSVNGKSTAQEEEERRGSRVSGVMSYRCERTSSDPVIGGCGELKIGLCRIAGLKYSSHGIIRDTSRIFFFMTQRILQQRYEYQLEVTGPWKV